MSVLRCVPLLILAGCTVGPSFEEPNPVLPEELVNAPDAGSTLDAGELWRSLSDDSLNALVATAIENNTTLAQAVAAWDETRALSNLAVYSLFPTVTVSGEVERNRQSTEDPFSFPGQSVVERTRAGFDAAWEIDLFGSLRRQSQRIEYLEQANAATAYAVRVAVIAEVAQSYYQWHGETARRELLRENIATQRDRVDILESSLAAGRGTQFDVASARAVERSLSATLPQLDSGISRAEQRLSALTGLPVQTLRADFLDASLPEDLPAMLTVGTPLEWLRRRPDVLAAERRFAAATATVGVEVAEYFPSLDLVGSFGWTGDDSSAIGDSDAERWRFAPGISWRILDFGRIRQRVSAAEASARGAYAAYEETWRLALEETENALSNYRAQTETVALLLEATRAAAEAARLAHVRYDAGADSYFAVLGAELRRIETLDRLASARVARATALAALYKALGGDFARAVVLVD